jgi:hypothetical protein
MAEYDNPQDLKIWQIVQKAAGELGKEIFSANDIVKKIHETMPDVNEGSIGAYVISMAPKHGSYDKYPTHHDYFEFLGHGKYRLLSQNVSLPTAISTLAYSNEDTSSACENAKTAFLQKYRGLIISWAKEHKDALITGRKDYHWKKTSTAESLEKRNHLTKLIVLSRIKNNGGLDLATLDEIMAWGFPNNPQFFPRDPNKCLEVTRHSFNLLDEEKPAEAICKLMSFPLIISRASKIIGLSNPNYFAIYDSRVGLALATLQDGDKRLIKIPGRKPQPGRVFLSDEGKCTSKDWGANYQKLMWVLEVIANVLNEESYPFNLADVEMALFMMGK